MKKLIFLFALLIVVLGTASAQVMGLRYYNSYTGTAADTVDNSGADTIYWTVTSSTAHYYTGEVDLNETSGSATYTGILCGRLASGGWTQLDTITATGDGTGSFEVKSTPSLWREYALIGSLSTTGVWEVDAIRFKIAPAKD